MPEICGAMKHATFFLYCITLCTFLSAQKLQTTREYINLYSSIAIEEMNKYNIPASIKMAQGILESSSGNSPLAKEAKNHFGIKCKKEWTGPTYIQDDDEKNECFRKYETVLASYEDHSKFLTKNQRYAELFTYDRSDYRSWAHGLKKAGYATNPKYAPLLIKTIEENNLSELDTPGKAPKFVEPVAGNERPKTSVSTSTGKKRSKNSDDTDLPDFELKKQGKRTIFVRNDVQYVVAKEGDTFSSIAQELDLMEWQLPKYNNLPSSTKLRIGETVYIQPKRRKAQQANHIVKAGEKMQEISQLYAIKLSRLYSLNDIEEGNQPKAGQKLKLR
jgi:LysM repeat protein